MRLHLRHTLVPAAALAVLALQGCAASGSPTWDSTFGDAARALSAQQLIDPNAPKRNGDKLSKLDGRSGRESHDRYVESFAAPPPPPVFTIGISGGK